MPWCTQWWFTHTHTLLAWSSSKFAPASILWEVHAPWHSAAVFYCLGSHTALPEVTLMGLEALQVKRKVLIISRGETVVRLGWLTSTKGNRCFHHSHQVQQNLASILFTWVRPTSEAEWSWPIKRDLQSHRADPLSPKKWPLTTPLYLTALWWNPRSVKARNLFLLDRAEMRL